MTISSTKRKAGPYTGNGTTTAFPFDFKVFTGADVLVISADTSSVQTTLVLNTDYTVTLSSNQDATPGGTVTLTKPLATNYSLVIAGQVPPLQKVALTNAGGFYPQVLNDALDLLTILVQQLTEAMSRALLAPISGSSDATALLAQLNSEMPAVAAVYTQLANVQAVAANQTNINTVSTSIDPIHAIGTDMTGNWAAGVVYDLGNIIDPIAGGTTAPAGNIVTVAGHITNVDTVATNIANVNAVGPAIASVNTVAGDIANINAAVADKTNIDTAATNIANVNAVGSNIANVNAAAVDLQGAPAAIDYGDLSAATNPATPTGVLASVYSNQSSITTTANNMASVVNVSTNMASILAALSGAVAAANNLSELTNPATARVNLGLADMGSLV